MILNANMRSIFKQYKIIFFLTIIGTVLRFYNLNWGAPFYFHPDERNIASAITHLHFPDEMNPQFFAYGSFPIYLTYFASLFVNFLTSFNATVFNQNVSFSQAIVMSRFFSATLSALLIPSLFVVGKKFWNEKTGLYASFFAFASVGFIQFSHFGTFEMWLTFLSLSLFYYCLKIVEEEKARHYIITAFLLGILLAVKISSFILFPLPVISIIFHYFRKHHALLQGIRNAIIPSVLLLVLALAMFLMLSPFSLLDKNSFTASIQYESNVATGSLPVFYTGGFYDTTPVLFQFLHVYPFLINPLLTIIFIFSFFSIIFVSCKNCRPQNVLLVTCCLLLFLPQAFLFAKWMRYMVPTLPFLYLIIAFAIDAIEHKLKRFLLGITMAFACIFAALFVFTAYGNTDTRIAASMWAKNAMPTSSIILSEVYDLGITPFNPYFPNITLFNFYDLEVNPSMKNTLSSLLSKSDYLILPSQRLLRNRLLNEKKFPQGHTFYTSLQNGSLRFEKIYETPCDLSCTITYMGNPLFALEETANVFDRPTIFIFKKLQTQISL